MSTAVNKQPHAHKTDQYDTTSKNRGRCTLYLGIAVVVIVVHLVHFYSLQLLRTVHEVRHLGRERSERASERASDAAVGYSAQRNIAT